MSDDEDNRPPIDVATVTTGGWRVEVVAETTSTNAGVADRFRGGEDEGLVLVAEHQTAGRGRLGRDWVAPPRSSLIVSFLLQPEAPPQRWPWLPLLTGVAAADAVRRVTGVEVGLKWPNDLLAADGHKLGGILLERVEHDGKAAAVVGIGINCAQTTEELPVPEATSLALVTGSPVDRSTLLAALVEQLAERYRSWQSGADLRPAYLALCRTLGQEVQVTVPGDSGPGGGVRGHATDVDEGGRLVVQTDGGVERLGAGDVVHVRPARA